MLQGVVSLFPAAYYAKAEDLSLQLWNRRYIITTLLPP